EQRDLKQWFIKITDYSDELLQRHDRLSNGHWPEQVLSMQRNWIGKSEGAEVDFDIAQTDKKLKVFTTRPDTLFGATFMAIAPEHAIINELQSKIKNWEEISKYIKASAAKTNIERAQNKEKTGVEIKGVKAINPLTKKEIPIFTADYVLTGYGTGAIMAVPAHDQRDWDFAKKFNLEIIEVIKGENSDIKNAAFEEEGVLINSGHFNGLKSTEAVKIVSDWIEKEKIGKKTINFKFKDWLISRQRYWGTPVPMIHCPKCGIVPVNFEDLPVKLPENIEFTGIGDSPLKSSAEFLNVKCPKCGGGAKRDADTMDTFIDSSWYYARYCDPKNDKEPFDFKSNYWLPVDQYIGGIEHACMHLMYARFWHKIMRDLGLVKSDEPFTNLLTQGMVTLGGSAMSKSRGNTVSPDAMIEKYGADAVRLFILFAAPPQKQLEWSLEGIEGAWRFVNRVWRLQEIVGVFDNNAEISDGGKNADSQEKENLIKTMHKTIKKTAEDIEKKFQFNTAISAIMELVNLLYLYTNHQKDGGVSKEVYKTVILLLSPFTPHLCEEIWRNLGEKNYISLADFPKFDAALIKDEIVEIPVQINGKIRSRVSVSADASEEEVRKTMESDEKTAKNLAGREVIKFIYVKNKIASFTIE
ncbi:MAG: leucine--tRNA ligase, partial [Elusimicrobiota bacterium]|nr:leucine--tRNA ligase [Elusimicrobiota bacterium]